jgi:5-methylcytosine-specific restriction endonuclease McrA
MAKYKATYATETRNYALKWRTENFDPVKSKETSRVYRIANLQKITDYQNKRRSKPEFKARQALISKAKYAKNSIAIKASVRKWYLLNRDKAKETHKAWRAANPDQTRLQGNLRRAREQNAEGTYTVADIHRIGLAQNWKCYWCSTPSKEKYHVDHVVALSRGGSNWPSNLVISCQPCNSRKHAKDPVVFARELRLMR